MSAATDELLREIGVLAAANSDWNPSHHAENDIRRRAAEERAHSAGVSWKRIDRVRMVGFSDQGWRVLRDSARLEQTIRACLLQKADAYAWLLRYMVAVEVLRGRQRRADRATDPPEPDFGQQRRNMAGLAATVEIIAVLTDMIDTERAAVREIAMAGWPRMMAVTAEVMDTPDAIEEVWQDLGDPWFQHRSDRIADSVRHRIPEGAVPVLATLEELTARAERAVAIEPQDGQVDHADRRRAGELARSAVIDAAVHPGPVPGWEPAEIPDAAETGSQDFGLSP